MKGNSLKQDFRAFIANKLTLPLVVLESLKQGKKINNRIIAESIGELKKIVAYLDKKWMSI